MGVARCKFNFLSILALFLCANCGSARQASARAYSNSWIDDLGYTSIMKLPFVSFTPMANGAPMTISGFLLSRKNGIVKVFSIGLGVEIYKQQQGVNTAPVNFESWVGQRLNYYETAETFNAKLTKDELKSMYDFAPEAYVLSRACNLRGYKELAGKCLDYAKRFASIESLPLDEDVHRYAEQALFGQLYANFDDHDYTRDDLAREFERYLAEFPDSPFDVRAKDDLKTLRAMLVQDKARSKSSSALASLPGNERIREEIYRLRDHFGNFWDPYEGDIVYGGMGSFTQPPQDLPAIESAGLAAVPLLIQSLKDRTFTRSICYNNGKPEGMVVLRVGDICERIIEHIAHRTFAAEAAAPMQNDPTGVEAAIEKWWAARQSGGEEPGLISAVRGTDWRSILDSAKELADKYPQDASGPISDAIAKEQQSNFRTQLIQDLGLVHTDAAKTSLERLMDSGPDLAARATACGFVHAYKPDQAFNAAIATLDWHQEHPGDWVDDQTSFPDLLEEITTWKGAQGIQLLRDRMKTMPSGIKKDVLDYFDQKAFFRQGQTADSDSDRALESLLVNELDDRSDGEVIRPRSLCQVAGECLNRLWPAKYPFLPAGSQEELNRQRIANINTWRKANGVPPESDQLSQPSPVAPAATMLPLLDAALDSPNAGDRQKALSQLRQIGVPGMPAIMGALASHAQSQGAQGLSALARKLDVTVADAEVRNSQDSAAKAWARTEKGKVLNAGDILRLLKSLIVKHAPGVQGLRFSAMRDRGSYGIKCVLDFGHKPWAGNGFYWTIDVDGTMVPMGSGDGGGADFGKDPSDAEALDDVFGKPIQAALAARPNQTISIQIDILLVDR